MRCYSGYGKFNTFGEHRPGMNTHRLALSSAKPTPKNQLGYTLVEVIFNRFKSRMPLSYFFSSITEKRALETTVKTGKREL